MRDGGYRGENKVEAALLAAGVPRWRFWTEKELVAMNERARLVRLPVPFPRTPDVLFRKDAVVVNGRQCAWLDSKNMLLVPGVSAPQELDSFRAQVDAYCELFGPGAVVWHRPFLKDLADALARPQHVAMFTVEAIPGSKEALDEEKQRQKQLRNEKQRKKNLKWKPKLKTQNTATKAAHRRQKPWVAG